MITNYLFLNRELLDEVYSKHGSVLVVLQNRADATNFYNELLMLHRSDTGVMCSGPVGKLWVASKASRVTITSLKHPNWIDSLRGSRFTKVFTVGTIHDEENRQLSMCLR